MKQNNQFVITRIDTQKNGIVIYSRFYNTVRTITQYLEGMVFETK